MVWVEVKVHDYGSNMPPTTQSVIFISWIRWLRSSNCWWVLIFLFCFFWLGMRRYCWVLFQACVRRFMWYEFNNMPESVWDCRDCAAGSDLGFERLYQCFSNFKELGLNWKRKTTTAFWADIRKKSHCDWRINKQHGLIWVSFFTGFMKVILSYLWIQFILLFPSTTESFDQ